jgi:hypothetical protein
MDYQILKNQNVWSLTMCLSLILLKLILMMAGELKLPHNTYSFHQKGASISMRKITRQMFSKQVSQLCPTAALFHIPFTWTQPLLHWWLLG